MEEKEHEIARMLKACPDDMVFYTPIYGDTLIEKIYNNAVIVVPKHSILNSYTETTLYYESKYGDGGSFILYPSYDYFKKYPLDAKKAWQEWKDGLKPYRLNLLVTSKKGNNGWCEYLFTLPEMRFRTMEEKEQAFNEIKKLLADWHNRKEGEK